MMGAFNFALFKNCDDYWIYKATCPNILLLGIHITTGNQWGSETWNAQ